MSKFLRSILKRQSAMSYADHKTEIKQKNGKPCDCEPQNIALIGWLTVVHCSYRWMRATTRHNNVQERPTNKRLFSIINTYSVT